MSLIWQESPADFYKTIREKAFTNVVALCFISPAIEACQNVLQCFEELIKVHNSLIVSIVDVNNAAMNEVKELYQIQRVPTLAGVVGFKLLERLESADIPVIVTKISEWCENHSKLLEEVKEANFAKIREILQKPGMTIFIKGSPQQPRCKFTRKLLELIKGYEFNHFDILADDSVREYLKIYSKWPTYPQVYVNGEFIGGVDIVESLTKTGDFINSSGQNLNDRLRRLTSIDKIVLFMKGVPENPFCGFSEAMVQLLAKYDAKYTSFDIFSDPSVREGLKVFSNWPTFPQLYVDGNLIGGIDIARQMDESGELEPILKAN